MPYLKYPPELDADKMEAATGWLVSKYAWILDESDIIYLCLEGLEASIKTYNPDKSALPTYYRTVAERRIWECLQRKNAIKRKVHLVDIDAAHNVASDNGANEGFTVNEICRLANLSTRDEYIIMKFFVDGFSLHAIGKQLDISGEYAARRFKQSLKKLKKVIDK